MNFLPIVERELRTAARRPSTYWIRFFIALATLGLWAFLMVALQGAARHERSQKLVSAMGVLCLGFCLLSGCLFTADCLSEEKRNGTLGLLFLTDLKSFDVVLGKLVATSLHAFYGLLVVFPIMALTLLWGGVTSGECGRLVLVLLATLFLSLSSGLCVSSLFQDTRLLQ
jgi:ABC-type transport system involved in multi-copper enzyme maturation permease subunit